MSKKAISSVHRQTAEQLHTAAIRILRTVRTTDHLLGIGPAQASALSVLVFAGPKSLKELAAIEQVKPPTMSRIVAALQEAGLISRKISGEDARAIQLAATEKGRRLMLAGRQRRTDLLAAMLAHSTPSELETLRAAAERIQQLLSQFAPRNDKSTSR